MVTTMALFQFYQQHCPSYPPTATDCASCNWGPRSDCNDRTIRQHMQKVGDNLWCGSPLYIFKPLSSHQSFFLFPPLPLSFDRPAEDVNRRNLVAKSRVLPGGIAFITGRGLSLVLAMKNYYWVGILEFAVVLGVCRFFDSIDCVGVLVKNFIECWR